MQVLAILGGHILAILPSRFLAWIFPNRDTYRGAMIEPKAYALGQLSNLVRDDGHVPDIADSRALNVRLARILDNKAPRLARIEDIEVAGADGLLRARLYSDHAETPVAQPAMVFYHGGGFVQGDLDSHHQVCAKLAKWWGGIVIAVDYRLAPEHPYPEGADDAIAAYLHVVENATALGLDPERIGVGGDSAGGCLAAVVAQQVLLSGGPVPRFQVLLYPVTDGYVNSTSVNDLKDIYMLPKTRMLWYHDLYAGDFRDFDEPKFSPLFARDFTGLPDSYVVTCGFDPLLDDGADYVAKLEAAGIAVTHRHFEGQVHAFVNLTKVIPEGTTALREIATWLRGIR